MLCSLIESLISIPGGFDKIADKSRKKNFLCQVFVFSFLWSLGGNLLDHSQEMFEVFVRDLFEEHPDARYELIYFISTSHT